VHRARHLLLVPERLGQRLLLLHPPHQHLAHRLALRRRARPALRVQLHLGVRPLLQRQREQLLRVEVVEARLEDAVVVGERAHLRLQLRPVGLEARVQLVVLLFPRLVLSRHVLLTKVAQINLGLFLLLCKT